MSKNFNSLRVRILFLALLSSLLFYSCTLKTVKPTGDIPPYRGAAETLEMLSVSSAKVENIRGIMTVHVFNEKGESENSISGYVAFAPPDKMSFSYVGPLGMIFFAAVKNGEKVIFYLPQQRRAYIGNVNEMKSGPLNNSLLITPFSVPAGDIFFIEHQGVVSTLYGLKKIEEKWEISEKLIIDREKMRPVERRIFTNGVEVLRIAYLEYTDVDGVSIPTLVSIKDMEKGGDVGEVKIALKKVEINKDLNPDLFDVDVGEPWIVDGISNFVIPKY